MLAFDLDHFKSINDRFGHKTAMRCCKLFAKVARKTMRADDIIGRFGGEEFVALMSGTLADAGVAAERVRAAFKRRPSRPTASHCRRRSASAWPAVCRQCPIDVLIARADAALYRAKANGRNRVEPDEELVTGAPSGRAKRSRGAGRRGIEPRPAQRRRQRRSCMRCNAAARLGQSERKGRRLTAPFSLHRLQRCLGGWVRDAYAE